MLERIKKSTFTAPLLVLVVGLLSVAGQILLQRVTFNTKEELFLTYTVAELLIFVLPGIVYVKMKKGSCAADMHLVSFGFSKLPLVLLCFFVMSFGAVLINLFASGQAFGEGLSQNAQLLSGGEYLSSARTILYVSLTLGVVPAFAEEFLFRGVLLYEYREYGAFPSVIITSLYFAMMHFDFKLFPYYFASGLILGFTAYTARSAFASAVLHSLYNLFALFALPLVLNFISLEAGVIVFYFAGILFLLFLMLALGECERLFAGYSAAGLRSDKRKRRKDQSYPPFLEMISPTFLVCLLLFILGVLQVIRYPANMI